MHIIHTLLTLGKAVIQKSAVLKRTTGGMSVILPIMCVYSINTLRTPFPCNSHQPYIRQIMIQD